MSHTEDNLSPQASFPQVFALGTSDKLRLLEDLWESIAADPGQIPVMDWQKQELDAREAEYRQNPDSGAYWEEVKRRIRERNAR
ncbi:MAG: addiction module protein [Planctomycetes bacterium]|nr:addiction module protein [Planctomycetota bacterium]